MSSANWQRNRQLSRADKCVFHWLSGPFPQVSSAKLLRRDCPEPIMLMFQQTHSTLRKYYTLKLLKYLNHWIIKMKLKKVRLFCKRPYLLFNPDLFEKLEAMSYNPTWCVMECVSILCIQVIFYVTFSLIWRKPSTSLLISRNHNVVSHFFEVILPYEKNKEAKDVSKSCIGRYQVDLVVYIQTTLSLIF